MPAPKLKIGNKVDLQLGVVMYYLCGGDAFWNGLEYSAEKAEEFWGPTMREATDGAATIEDLVKAFYYVKHYIVPHEIRRFVEFIGPQQKEITA